MRGHKKWQERLPNSVGKYGPETEEWEAIRLAAQEPKS